MFGKVDVDASFSPTSAIGNLLEILDWAPAIKLEPVLI
jgi:hypothetical protein